MTEGTFGDFQAPEGFDEWDPANVAPMVAFLAGPHASKVSGQVFIVFGGTVIRTSAWPQIAKIETDHRWTVEELQARLPEIAEGLEARPPVFDVETPGSIVHGGS